VGASVETGLAVGTVVTLVGRFVGLAEGRVVGLSVEGRDDGFEDEAVGMWVGFIDGEEV